MDTNTLNTLMAGLVGLIAGVIGSLIAPWVNWGIEKKRIKQQRRIELIKQWRDILLSENFHRSYLLNHPSYGPLRELLDKKILEIIERPSNHFNFVINGPPKNLDISIILKEISRIEKMWDLI